MKVSAATFAVLLATAAFCAPASASPCKSGPDHCSLEPDPHTGPDFALLSAAAFMLSEPDNLPSYILLCLDVQLSQEISKPLHGRDLSLLNFSVLRIYTQAFQGLSVDQCWGY